MSDIKSADLTEIKARQLEETLYEAVGEELAGGVRREGLWLRAVADARGDEAAARSLYIRYRAQSMHDEAALRQAEEKASLLAQRAREKAKARARYRDLMDLVIALGLFSVLAVAISLCGR